MKLTISARNLQEGVNYIPFKQEIKKETSYININHFPLKQIEKEVKNLSLNQKKKIMKISKKFILTASSILALTLPTIVSATAQIDIPTNAIPQATFPKEIIELVKWILVTTVGIGVSQALIMIVLSAMVRMIPNDKAKTFVQKWNDAILRGFLQVIIGAPIIFFIWYLANKILGNSEWFISPF